MNAPVGGVLRLRLALLMLAPILLVIALLIALPPDGVEHSEWLQFLGRVHVLAVHLPIALILLVPVLEIAGRSDRLSHLRLSAGFVLGLATLSAIAAALLGWCLARGGGNSGSLIVQHMWGGAALTLICWGCWIARVQIGPSRLYSAFLALAVALVVFTGYRGGQLSLGANHLTAHMPAGLRRALGVTEIEAPAAADPNTFYGARVQPIFAAHCISCHGSERHKADLRLDSYKGLMHGGKDGPVIQAGTAQASDLIHRISLPASHDDFMPKGKSPLSPDEIKVIEVWIAAGASDMVPVSAIAGAPTSSTAAAAEVTFEKIDPAAVAQARSALAGAVAKLQQQFPNVLDYESRGSAALHLNASPLGAKFGDENLSAFAPIAEQIAFADLSRTAITDHSAGSIAAMKHLRVLRLTNTAITDATVQHLGSLDQLESMNVFGTAVTAAALPAVAKLPHLAHFYAGQTKITPGTRMPAGLEGKVVF